MSFNDPDLQQAVDDIDFAVFSGGKCANPENRAELRQMMARWERRLEEFDTAPCGLTWKDADQCPDCFGTGNLEDEECTIRDCPRCRHDGKYHPRSK